MFSALAVARHVAHADAAVVVMGPGHRRHQHPARVQRHGGRARSSTPPLRSAACRSRACASRSPTAATVTRALAPQRAPRCAWRRATGSTVAVPALGGPRSARLRADLDAAGIDRRHDLVEVDAARRRSALFAQHGLRIASMGRPAADDPALFQAARRGRRARGASRDASDRQRATPWLTGSSGWSTCIATLLDTRRPLTLDEIVRASSPATRRTWSRAGGSSSATRRRCASIGIPIRVESVDGSAPRQATGSTPTSTTSPSSS